MAPPSERLIKKDQICAVNIERDKNEVEVPYNLYCNGKKQRLDTVETDSIIITPSPSPSPPSLLHCQRTHIPSQIYLYPGRHTSTMKLPIGRCSTRRHRSHRHHGQELKDGILTSLQPLHPHFPDIIPPYDPTHTHLRSSSSASSYMYASSVASAAATAVSGLADSPVVTTISDMSAAATTATGVSPWRFLLIFTLGGLFFSTALALGVAFYTFGVDNVKRFTKIGLLIVSKVWESFVLALSLARKELLGIEDEDETKTTTDTDTVGDDDKSPDLVLKQQRQVEKKQWKWRDAWQVLKAQLAETRKTATQGVEALKQESTLYAAAVGQPGLIPFQYAIQKLFPYSLTTILEDSLKDSLRGIEPTKTIKRMKVNRFSAGDRSPVFQGARMYEIDGAMAFDFDIKWESELEAEIQIYTVGGFKLLPVLIKKLKFAGVVRVVLAPLIKEPPGYGAMLISLTSPPDLSLDVKVLGAELTKFRFLKSEITQVMQQAVVDNLLWPKRNVIPIKGEASSNAGPFGTGVGYGQLLKNDQLKVLQTTDPFLETEQKFANSDQQLVREVNQKRKQLDTDKGDHAIVINEQDDSIETNNTTDTTSTTTNYNDDADSIASKKSNDGAEQKTPWWNNIRNVFGGEATATTT